MTAVIKEGILLVNKPRGRSSFSMVAQVRRLSGIAKVGHAGTLDPEAEGLLILLVGKDYTKQADQFLRLDKTYDFDLKLGEESTTDDVEGQITKISDSKPTKSDIEACLAKFTGKLKQTPPIYSAIKKDGVRAYKLAARGEKPQLQSRSVTIKKLELINYSYPTLSLRADVSSGTYIRSLGRDIGRCLQTGAYVTKLKRIRIGRYKLEGARALE